MWWRPAMASRSRATTSRRTTSLPRSKAAPPALSTRRASCAPARPTTHKNGSTPSRQMLLARLILHIAVMAAALALPVAVSAETPAPYRIVGDGIPDSLTGVAGDAARGRALVLDRTTTCMLCHSGPFPETRFQGDLAPDLAGAGNRWSASQLRLRLVDAAHFNPETIMPSYYRTDGFIRVGRNWTGKPILTATQIEDIVAFL